MMTNLSRRRVLMAAAAAPLLGALPRSTMAATRRIVCAGGAVTECVFALGHGNEVVAVDTTSLYPASVTELPQIGYFRQLAIEGLLSMSPDLVIADRDAGPLNVLEQLAGTSGVLHQYTGPVESAAIPDKLRFVAGVLGEPAKGEEVAGTVAADLATLEQAVGRVARKPRAIFMLGTSKGRMAGRGTTAELVMTLAGADNLGKDFDGYRPISTEGIVGVNPEVIVTMYRGEPAEGADPALLAAQEMGIADLPKEAQPRVIVIDGAKLLALGPRSAHACYELAAQLHPELDWPGLPARPWVG